MSKELTLKETGSMLMAAQKIVLCCHVSPDGDTLGSALGLGRYLKQQGKEVTLFVDDDINKIFGFLPEIECCKRPAIGEKLEADVLCVIDASSADRIGIVNEVVEAKVLMNIDHHISNTLFADYLYLDAAAAATGEVMCMLFEEMGWEMDKEIATCFYTAISMDCGNFRFSNTTSRTMNMAAKLLDVGAKPNEISEAMEVRERANVDLWVKVLPTLTFTFDDRVAYISLSNDLYNKDVSTDNFISYPRGIEGVDVAVFFKAVEPEVTRVSMRSSKTDVAQVALHFGGGGHVRAAGCTINAPLEEAKRQLLEELGKVM